ncbi:MAG: hypothetical protein AAF802_01160 [Planctomycetota bacterium]
MTPFSHVAWLAICLCISFSGKITADAPITAIAFAPDGETALVGSQSGVRLYGFPDIAIQRRIRSSLTEVGAIEFSPDGRRVAIAGGTPGERGEVEMFAWPTMQLIDRSEGHEDSIQAIAWRDESSFATAGLDGEVLLWQCKPLKPSSSIKGHSKGVCGVSFLVDGTMLTASIDQSLRVWKSSSLELVRTLNNHTDSIHAVHKRPRDSQASGLPMCITISDDRTVRFWQPTIGRLVRFCRLDSVPMAVAWSRDGTRLWVCCDDGSVREIDPETAAVIDSIPAIKGSGFAIEAVPNGRDLLVGGRSGELKRLRVSR